MRRKQFLQTFFSALGAKKIIWTDQKEDSISGIILFDTTKSEEQQEFIWHMTENDVPNDRLRDLISFISENRLLNGDKLKIPVTEISFPFWESETKKKLFDELFKIKVDMLDEGTESDFFCIHD